MAALKLDADQIRDDIVLEARPVTAPCAPGLPEGRSTGRGDTTLYDLGGSPAGAIHNS